MLFYLFLFIGILCILLIIKSNIGVVNVNEDINSLITDTDFISIPDERAYYDETNIAIIELKKKVDEFGISEQDAVLIKELKKSISEGFEKWGIIVDAFDKLIEER